MIKNIMAILLLGILLVAGCTQLPPNDNGNNGFQEKELSFETVDKDFYSNIQEKSQKAIQNSEDFQELWNEIGSLKMLEEIDFSKYTVIAVFQGQKTSGGYHIVRIPKTTKLIKFETKTQQESEKNWIDELIVNELKGTDDQVASLSKCEYKNRIAYYLVRPCCDRFTELFDENGNSICLPGGGFTGKGDGK